MPLPDDSRLIAVLTEDLWQRMLSRVERRLCDALCCLSGIREHAVQVAVFPGQRCPARRAQCVRREAILESHAFVRNAIDVGSPDELAPIAAEYAERNTFSCDPENVPPCCCGIAGFLYPLCARLHAFDSLGRQTPRNQCRPESRAADPCKDSPPRDQLCTILSASCEMEAQRNPMFEVELSGVFEVRTATR